MTLAADHGQELDHQAVPTELARDSWHWVTLLVDRSSSMEELRGATIQGLNALIAQHAAEPTTRLRVVEFGTDNAENLELTLLYSNQQTGTTDVRALRIIDYRPRGSTPLLAAVLRAVAQLEPDVRPHDRALVVIQTDGMDNASPGVTLELVRQRIEAKQALGNWLFAYLGAELDAWQTGTNMGVGALNALSYSPTPAGVLAAYKVTSDATTRWRKQDGRRALGGAGFYPLQLPPPAG